jgi:multidrug resistance efflux pump
VTAGSPRFALLDTDSYYVLGYLEETKLHRFEIGDRAKITLLGDGRPLWGHVESLSAGITDRQQNSSGVLLPNITPTFSWVRLAQRVPVRVAIDSVPAGLRLVAGRTATVTILTDGQGQTGGAAPGLAGSRREAGLLRASALAAGLPWRCWPGVRSARIIARRR